MSREVEDNIVDEVHKRLDDLFEEKIPNGRPDEKGSGEKAVPLRDLKAAILSIEWEIDDEQMGKLISETGKLKDKYESDRVLHLFFHLLGSVAKYIKSNKATAHPDSIRFLNSVFTSLENIFSSSDMAETKRKQALLLEVDKFKELKKQIAIRKLERQQPPMPMSSESRAASRQTPVLTPEEDEADGETEEKTAGFRTSLEEDPYQSPHFTRAIEEIKQVIREELRVLRVESGAMPKGDESV